MLPWYVKAAVNFYSTADNTPKTPTPDLLHDFGLLGLVDDERVLIFALEEDGEMANHAANPTKQRYLRRWAIDGKREREGRHESVATNNMPSHWIKTSCHELILRWSGSEETRTLIGTPPTLPFTILVLVLVLYKSTKVFILQIIVSIFVQTVFLARKPSCFI